MCDVLGRGENPLRSELLRWWSAGREAASKMTLKWPLQAAVLLVAPTSLASCKMGVLDPQGPVGRAEKQMLLDALGVMLLIVVPTIVATLTFAWWYRASNARAQYRPEWTYSGRIEAITWGIPVLTVVFLGGLAYSGSHQVDPAVPLTSEVKPLEVQVVSMDWKWLFIYPDQGIASVNQLTIPAGTPVHFSLTSASVMNSFFIPQLGSMIYVMNGMSDQLNLQADQVGHYFGLSTDFSGDGFAGMHFDVNVVGSPTFSNWVDRTRGSGPLLDRVSYGALSKQSMDVAPFTYGSATPDLYKAIITQEISQADGPDTNETSNKVFPKQKQEK